MSVIIKNNTLQVTINPLGAELTHLIKNKYNYVWTVNPEFWNKTSPILFPIVGSLKNDCYYYKNKKYSLSRHGFARDFLFIVTLKTEESVTFLLKENAETLKKYPFYFTLEVCYTLINNKLSISYVVKNTGEESMPFSIGAHPAFALRSKLNDYTLLFEKDDILYTHELENNLFSDKISLFETHDNKVTLQESLFENDAIVFKNLQSKTITLLEHNKPYLKINFSDFEHFGIWKKSDAPFLCLEPWLGFADHHDSNGNLFEKKGIQILESGAEFTAEFSIEV